MLTTKLSIKEYIKYNNLLREGIIWSIYPDVDITIQHPSVHKNILEFMWDMTKVTNLVAITTELISTMDPEYSYIDPKWSHGNRVTMMQYPCHVNMEDLNHDHFKELIDRRDKYIYILQEYQNTLMDAVVDMSDSSTDQQKDKDAY